MYVCIEGDGSTTNFIRLNTPWREDTRISGVCVCVCVQKELATHSIIVAWEIPWTKKPAGYSPWGHKSQRRLRTKPPLVSTGSK